MREQTWFRQIWFGRFIAITICLLFSLMQGGCSVNGWGIASSRQYFQNADQTGNAVIVDSWGFIASTIPTDVNLAFGRVRTTYYFPGRRSTECKSPLAEQIKGHTELTCSKVFRWTDCRPLAKSRRADGVILHLADEKVGVTAGAMRTDMFDLDKNSNVWLYIAYRSPGSSPGKFWISEERP